MKRLPKQFGFVLADLDDVDEIVSELNIALKQAGSTLRVVMPKTGSDMFIAYVAENLTDAQAQALYEKETE